MKNISIFILEDEPKIATLLQTTAEKDLYHTEVAITSDQAFTLLKKYTPHLALLDIKLEGEDYDGFDIAAAIVEKAKKERVSIPIAFFTAYGDEEEYMKKAVETVGYACLLSKHEVSIADAVQKATKAAEEYLESLEDANDDPYKDLIISTEGKIIIRPMVEINEEDEQNPGKRVEKKRYVILDVDDLLYIEAIDGKAKFVTETDVYEMTLTLIHLERQLEELLPPEQSNKLSRVNSAYIANPSKIVAFDKRDKTNYVYFSVSDAPDRGGIPVWPLFTQILKQRLGKPVTTKKLRKG